MKENDTEPGPIEDVAEATSGPRREIKMTEGRVQRHALVDRSAPLIADPNGIPPVPQDERTQARIAQVVRAYKRSRTRRYEDSDEISEDESDANGVATAPPSAPLDDDPHLAQEQPSKSDPNFASRFEKKRVFGLGALVGAATAIALGVFVWLLLARDTFTKADSPALSRVASPSAPSALPPSHVSPSSEKPLPSATSVQAPSETNQPVVSAATATPGVPKRTIPRSSSSVHAPPASAVPRNTSPKSPDLSELLH